MATEEQAPAGHAQLSGHRPGEQLGLVVPAGTGAGTTGGRPGDQIDGANLEAKHHEPSQLAGDEPAIAVLETVHHLAGHPLEREGGKNAGIADLGRCAGQREAAAVAERGAGLVATGTERGEEHGGIGTRRVSQGFR